ncbi:hypothetical protein [Lederbergia galactosidilytica]|nr:hypothetical protein [Lederbergia galactosidilytica]
MHLNWKEDREEKAAMSAKDKMLNQEYYKLGQGVNRGERKSKRFDI